MAPAAASVGEATAAKTVLRVIILSLVVLSGGATRLTAFADDSSAADRATVASMRLENADVEPGNWMTHGRTYAETRFSPLDAINSNTVSSLELGWYLDLPTKRGIEATPLVVDGVMYTTGSWSMVYALDATNGKLLWSHDPKVDRSRPLCCGAVNRGPAIWAGNVYVGTLDGRLIALDATNGTPVWDVATTDPTQPYSITGAPRVVKGKVIIGNGGAEFGVRGYVSAYDAETGKLAWRFYTVPGNPADGFESPAMKMAAETWRGEWWTMGGGGTAWDSFSYDPKLDLLYIGVGNGGPWDRNVRSPGGGDNLFLASIVAVRPDNGEYVWHYQTTPGESWDYTATQQMVLTDLKLDGELRKVLLQAPKNGFFYILDRETGELLSAEPFVTVNWATHVDSKTGRPVETPGARYEKRPFEARPGPLGGHTWQSMAYHPETGLVYIPSQDLPNLYVADKDFSFIPGALNFGVRYQYQPTPVDPAQVKAVRASLDAFLLAWNPATQSEAWRVPHAGPGNGGVLATAGGLVFQGTANGRFKAFSAASGEEIWSRATQTGVLAAPITYIAGGEQYVAVMVGWGGAYALAGGILNDPQSVPNVSRVLAYKLDGKAKLPRLQRQQYIMPKPPPKTMSKSAVEQGQVLYHRFCYLCHGANVVSVRVTPDLRASGFLASKEGWRSVIRDGALAEQGMVSFSKILDDDQVEAIRGYVIMEAWAAYNAEQAADGPRQMSREGGAR